MVQIHNMPPAVDEVENDILENWKLAPPVIQEPEKFYKCLSPLKSQQQYGNNYRKTPVYNYLQEVKYSKHHQAESTLL